MTARWGFRSARWKFRVVVYHPRFRYGRGSQGPYAELRERLVAFEAGRAIGHAQGSFVTKTVKSETYYYFQYLEPGGAKRQRYLGRQDETLDGVVAAHRESRVDVAVERESTRRLCSLLRTGGALVTDAPTARVLRALSEAGVFHLGGVLVGTHAYAVIGNLLGVSWGGTALRTQDMGVAAVRTLSVALGDLPTTDVPGVLESLKMGFLPLPGLDPDRPSTSFMVRGQGLRVDLLTPLWHDRDDGPVSIPRFRATAQPLKYLDYVIEHPVRGAIVDGEGVLVNVPSPARFAFHKLIVATARPVAMHVKRNKDLHQAAQVFSVLVEERPGDVEIAWEALEARGQGWVKRVRRELAELEKVAPELAGRILPPK